MALIEIGSDLIFGSVYYDSQVAPLGLPLGLTRRL